MPSQYLDASQDNYVERTRRGLCVMATSLAAGNPSIAARLIASCLRIDEKGRMFATLPANSDPRPIENSAVTRQKIACIFDAHASFNTAFKKITKD